jgi:hypothetical protein
MILRRHARAKRVEDARKRAGDPRIHHFSKKMDRRVKPGDDERGNQRRALEKQMAGRKPGHRMS